MKQNKSSFKWRHLEPTVILFYFSRDYKKLFGAPPQRDSARLRGGLAPGGAPARV